LVYHANYGSLYIYSIHMYLIQLLIILFCESTFELKIIDPGRANCVVSAM